MSLTQVAARLKVSPSTVSRLVKSGTLVPVFRDGKIVVFARVDVETIAHARAVS